jgi:hypothetical protein
MKKIILLPFLLFYFCGFSQKFNSQLSFNTGKQYNAKHENTVNIYLEIGDSNAGGPVVEPSGWDTAKYNHNDNVLIFFKPDLLEVNFNGAWEIYRTLNPANRRPGFPYVTTPPYAVGADQSFVYAIGHTELLKNKLAYFKVGVGGSTLITAAGTYNDWNPDNSSPDVDLWLNFIKGFTTQGLAALHTYKNKKIKGVVVRLGTNDCKVASWNQAAFLAAVPRFVAALSLALGEPALPIYWVQVNINSATATGFSLTNVNQVRQILTDCASGGATPITNFYLLNYDSDALESDNVHYTPASFVTQGEDYGNIFIPLGN